jgi:hypothetical protein
MGHVATIPLGNPPNNLFNGCLNLANAFPLCISTMHFHSSSTHVVVLEIDILIILNYYCYYYYSYFPIIWPIYNHCMVNIQHEKVNIRHICNQHTIHIQSTYGWNTIVGIKVWTFISLETIQGLCHPTTIILHCNKTSQNYVNQITR